MQAPDRRDAVTAFLRRCDKLLPASFHIGSDDSWDLVGQEARRVVQRHFGAVTAADPLCDTTLGLLLFET